jgi:hypothetical protein
MTGLEARDRQIARKSLTRRVFGTTPRRLILLSAGLGALSLLTSAIFASALGSDSSSFTDLKARTTEVSATTDLYYELNDMDAQAANALLVGYHPADPSMVPASVDTAASVSVYESDRSAADADLAQIAGDPLLTAQAEKLLGDLGTYEALVAQALYVDQNASTEKPATPPAAALASYSQASALLHTTLLPTSLQIANTDSSVVDGSYSAEHSTALTYGYLILALALLTGLGFYLGHRFHSRRFRRRLSWLVPGVALCLALGVLGLSTQLGEAGNLHYAKQEAYDSINALTRAKAVSDDANADESRWLLEARSPALQTSFFQKASSVAGVPQVSATAAGNEPHAYYAGLASAVGTLRLNASADSVSGVTIGGYLGTELNNITFPGEAQAAYATTEAFNAYIQDDATIRSQAASGNLAGAAAFDIGTQPGQSNYAFNQYTTKLDTVIQINDNAFTSGIAAGLGTAGTGRRVALIVGGLLLLLCVARAAYVRLREYR